MKIMFVAIITTLLAACNDGVSEFGNILDDNQESKEKARHFSTDFDFTILENLSDYMDVYNLDLDFGGVQTKSGISYLRADYPSGITNITWMPTEALVSPNGTLGSITITGSGYGVLLFNLIDLVTGISHETIAVTDSNTGTTTQTFAIPINDNENGQPRLYSLEYFNTEVPGFVSLTNFVQAYANISFASNITQYPLPEIAGNYIVTQKGNYPSQNGEYAMIRVYYGENHIDNSIHMIAYPLNSCQISIAENNTFSYRPIELQYATDAATPTWVTFETHMQRAETVYSNLTNWRVATTSSDPLTAYGGTAIISLSGDYSEIPVRIWGYSSLGDEVFIGESTVKKGVFPTGISDLPSGFDGAVAVSVPVFEDNGWPSDLMTRYLGTGIRQWSVQAQVNGQWTLLTEKDGYPNTINQPWFRISMTERMNEAPKEYSQWPFKIQGYWQNAGTTNMVRIRLVTNPAQPLQSLLMEKYIDAHDNSSVIKDYTISIPANITGKSRVIFMIYSLDDGVTWNSWYQGWTLIGQGDGFIVQQG